MSRYYVRTIVLIIIFGMICFLDWYISYIYPSVKYYIIIVFGLEHIVGSLQDIVNETINNGKQKDN